MCRCWHDSELCPQNLALLLTSWVISYSSMALNTINILMTSQYQSLIQSSPLNTGSYSAASITCPFDSPAAISDSTSSTHNSWFPFPTVYFLSQQMALPLTQLLWHQTWGHPWLTPFLNTHIQYIANLVGQDSKIYVISGHLLPHLMWLS